MPHHLPALLTFLAAPSRLAADDVDPLAIYDRDTCAIWMSEVCRNACGTRLDCRLKQMGLRNDSVHPMIHVAITADRSLWSIESCAVTGKAVGVDPETVLAVFAGARHQIRAGLVPAFEDLLRDHAGLQLPILGPCHQGD